MKQPKYLSASLNGWAVEADCKVDTSAAWLQERRWIQGCAREKLCMGGLKLFSTHVWLSWDERLISARLSFLSLAALQPVPLTKCRHRLYIRQVPSQMQVIWMARTQIRRAAHQAALAHPQHTVRAVKAHYIQQYVTVQNCSCERGTMRNCAQQQPGLQQCLQLPVVFTPAAGHVCDTAAPEHVYRRREGSYDWVTCVIWLHVPGPLCYLPHVMTTAVT